MDKKQMTVILVVGTITHVLSLFLTFCAAKNEMTWSSCTGGPFLKGISADLWENNDGDPLGCCDSSGSCYSSIPGDVAEIADSLQATLTSHLPILREKFVRKLSQDLPDGDSSTNDEDLESDKYSMGLCCGSQISVFYPLSGISAISGRKVSIIQYSEFFKQPVVYERCRETPCRILRGNCTQVYTPVPLYVFEVDSFTSKLDFVFVETGCRCRNTQVARRGDSELGVDKTAREALSFFTGRTLLDEELTSVPFQNLSNNDGQDVIVTEEELLLCNQKPEEQEEIVLPSSIINESSMTRAKSKSNLHLHVPNWHDVPLSIQPGDYDPVLHLIKHLVDR